MHCKGRATLCVRRDAGMSAFKGAGMCCVLDGVCGCKTCVSVKRAELGSARTIGRTQNLCALREAQGIVGEELHSWQGE